MDESQLKNFQHEIDQKTLELYDECKAQVAETLERYPNSGETGRSKATEAWLIQKIAALQVVVLQHGSNLEQLDARLPR